ncbi:MAG TPA: DUF2127 domain-containing protein [Chloroflexota bacterium]|jgi:uncharacterized membrane protein (DUF2068 family)
MEMLHGRTFLGRPLGITLIVIQKSVWALVLIVASVALFAFHSQHVTQPFQEFFEGELSEDPHDLLATVMIHLVPQLSLQTEILLAFGAILYAILEIIEAWGLWRFILWVELLTVFETSAFLPYEIWDIFQHVSVLKVVTFVINILIIWYLYTRYLRRRAEHLAHEVEQKLEQTLERQ